MSKRLTGLHIPPPMKDADEPLHTISIIFLSLVTVEQIIFVEVLVVNLGHKKKSSNCLCRLSHSSHEIYFMGCQLSTFTVHEHEQFYWTLDLLTLGYTNNIFAHSELVFRFLAVISSSSSDCVLKSLRQSTCFSFLPSLSLPQHQD